MEAKDSVTLVLGLPANFGMKPIALTVPAAGAHQRRPKALSESPLAVPEERAVGNGTEVGEQKDEKRHKHKNRRWEIAGGGEGERWGRVIGSDR